MGIYQSHMYLNTLTSFRILIPNTLTNSRFTVVPITKGKWLVQSVPGELNLDQTLVLQKASSLGTAWVCTSILITDLG